MKKQEKPKQEKPFHVPEWMVTFYVWLLYVVCFAVVVRLIKWILRV